MEPEKSQVKMRAAEHIRIVILRNDIPAGIIDVCAYCMIIFLKTLCVFDYKMENPVIIL